MASSRDSSCETTTPSATRPLPSIRFLAIQSVIRAASSRYPARASMMATGPLAGALRKSSPIRQGTTPSSRMAPRQARIMGATLTEVPKTSLPR